MAAPSNRVAPHLDVVFVHGLGSDPNGWLNEKTGFNWPDALKEDKHLRVLNRAYHAPMFNFQDTNAVNAEFQSAAQGFLAYLRNNNVGANQPIVFVAHSLGGIIVKEALRIAEASDDKDDNLIFRNTERVIFLATPHAGAAIANAAAYVGSSVRFLGALATSPLGTALGFILQPVIGIIASRAGASKLTLQLTRGDAELLALNRWYRTVGHIETDVFYETELTYGCVHVVDPLSADPGVHGCVPRRAEQKDHMTISKPKGVEDQLFIDVRAIIERVRMRVGMGKHHPVFQKEIREFLSEDYASYVDAGNFKDIPAANDVRKHVEERLRQKFRDLFKRQTITPEQERRAAESRFDIDKFALSLWLETKVAGEFKTLRTFIEKAESSLNTDSGGKEPPTAILLYRAARTLDRVLLELNYTSLEQLLKKAHGSAMKRYQKDKESGLDNGFDANCATQKELHKLMLAAGGFQNVISTLPATR